MILTASFFKAKIKNVTKIGLAMAVRLFKKKEIVPNSCPIDILTNLNKSKINCSFLISINYQISETIGRQIGQHRLRKHIGCHFS